MIGPEVTFIANPALYGKLNYDPINGFKFLSEAYLATKPDYRGRYTVPVLWDKRTKRIVNNSEDDICRMFNDTFSAFGNRAVDLFPKDIEAEHAEIADPN